MDTDRNPAQPPANAEPESEPEPEPGSVAPTPGSAPLTPGFAPPAPLAGSAASVAAGRGRRSWLVGAVVGIALVVTFSAGIGVGRLLDPSGPTVGRSADPASGPAPSAPTDFGLIKEAWDTLHDRYVGKSELDDRALIYGAIEGLTQAVGDTGHTDFMDPQERADRNDALSGSYVGIGVRINPTDDGLPQVVGVFDGSPAEGAALQVGDIIVAVDGRTTAGNGIDTVAGWVRGEAGSTVELTLRSATGGERVVSIVRADVPIQPVSWALVPGTSTALIRLEQFSSGAADEMVKALDAARAAGADRLVLDLRGNPGGYVNEAVGIASQFLSSGLVYIERNADDERTEHPVSPGGVATDLPLVVVVDGNTASSAEIVSGALQDAGRATIVGETTYGTGTVLGEFVLSDGSALRVGTVEWLTPDGRRIWHTGIAPDVPASLADGTVPLTPDDVAKLTPGEAGSITDAQIGRALELVLTQTIAVR